jgi:hypothetical protein
MESAARVTAAAAVFALIALSAVLRPRADSLGPWKAAVLLAARTDGASLDAALKAGGVSDAVSSESQEVAFNAFSYVERLKLRDVPRRLEDEDPRKDTYIKALNGYFRAESDGTAYALCYLSPTPFLRERIGRALKALPSLGKNGDGWFIVESAADSPAWPAISGLAAMVIVLIILEGRKAIAPLIPLAAFIPVIALGGRASAAPSLAAAYLIGEFSIARRRFPYAPGRGGGGFLRAYLGTGPGKTIIAGTLAAILLSLAVPAVALAALAALVLVFLAASLSERRAARKSSHGVFMPLPLRGGAGGSWSVLKPLHVLPAIVPIAVFIAGMTASLPKTGALLSIPHPRRYTATGPAMKAILPSYSDYLEHMRFQESFGKTRLLDPAGGRFGEIALGVSGFVSEVGGDETRAAAALPRIGIERFLKAEGAEAVFSYGPWPEGMESRILRSGGSARHGLGFIALIAAAFASAAGMARKGRKRDV